jgi:serine/threonine-protein kinase
MFEREKYIVSQLRHPNIVRCGDTGCCGDVHFIEMEYLSGGSVWDMMKNGGKVPLDEAVPIMLQTLEGLAYAHQAVLTVQLKSGEKTVRGIVHRDLKPPNILLGGSSNNRIAKVSDFGLSKAFSEAGMTKGSVTADVGDCCGSPPYMAPEHVVNYKYVKPSTDVFEIAATFYHMLTGVPVWRPRRGVEIIKVILEESVTPIRKQDSRIPKKLGDVLDRALARNAGARYQDAGEMLKAMRKAV